MEVDEKKLLHRAMGYGDLVLFYIGAVVGLRWISVAAKSGPSGLVIWLVAAVTLFVPLAFTVVELSSRYPQEGGIYIWSKRAFGDFGGFMTGWTYWVSNIFYFPGLLTFFAGSLIYMCGEQYRGQAQDHNTIILMSIAGLAVAVVLNVVGLDIAKWLHNFGGVTTWIPALMVVIVGGLTWWMFGSATKFTLSSFVPKLSNIEDAVFWSTIAFAFGGLESASIMSEEIKDARRNIPRAILTAGIIIATIYIIGTLGVLVSMNSAEVSGIEGIPQALSAAGGKIGYPALGEIAAGLLALATVGGTGVWLASTARLPFVAGIDSFLPPAFARIHPRWGTPYVAILVQSGVAVLVIFLAHAGENTRVDTAYQLLVAMGTISYFLPYLLMFAAMIRLQREEAGPDTIRVPGGMKVAILVGAVGFVTTALSIGLALVPPREETEKWSAFAKVFGLILAQLVVGVTIYAIGKLKQRTA